MNLNRSRLSGPQIFGLDIEKLHQYRLEISTVLTASRKRPLSMIQSRSGQNKRFAAFGKDSEQELSSLLITKYKYLHLQISIYIFISIYVRYIDLVRLLY